MNRALSGVIYLLFTMLAVNLFAQDIKMFITSKDSVVVTALRDNPIPQYSSVATKFYVPLQKIPMSVGVVNTELIEKQNSFVLSDALKNISSVNAQTGFGVHDYFIIRGFNSLDNALIVMDGTPEPEVTYYNLYNIDRVEVLKGSGAFLYGSNPLSGTVNLNRKQPVFRNFLNSNTTYGQYNTFRQAIDAGFASPNKKFASRINMLYENSENYRDDKQNQVMAVNPSFTGYVGKTTLNLNVEYINSKYKPDTGVPLVYNMNEHQLDALADVPRTQSYQTPFDKSTQEITRVKLGLHRKFGESINFQSQFYYTKLDWNSQGTLLNGAFPTMTGSMAVNRSWSYLEDERNLFGNQNEWVWSFNTGRLNHSLLTGFEWNVLLEDYRYDNVPSLPALDLYNPMQTAVENELVLYPYLSGDVQNSVMAPYVIDRISFSDKLNLTLGMRYDIIDFKNKAVGYKTDRTFQNVSHMAGLVYSPFPVLSFYANTGKAYAPPSSQVVGEQDAEESSQFEFGVKQRYWDSRICLDIAWYNIEKENMAMPTSDGIIKQLGNQRSTGFEVELQTELLPSWFTFVNYAYTYAELTRFSENVAVGQNEYGMPIYMLFDRSGNTPAFVPEHLLNFWTTKEFAFGLGIGGGVRYIGSQYIDDDNVYEIDAAVIVDAMLYYNWQPFKFSLNFKNLTNEEYFIRGFNNSSVVPAPARGIYGNIAFSL